MTTNTDTKRTAHNTGHTPYTGHLERGPDRIYNGPAIRLDLAGYGGAVELGFEGCTMAEAPDDYATFIVRACNSHAALVEALKIAQDNTINALMSGHCSLTPGIKQDMQRFLGIAREALSSATLEATP